MKLVGVCLITNNVPALADYYSRILGVQAEGDEHHVELKVTGAGLTIFSTQGMENMAPHSMEGAGYGSVTIGFEVADVDAEYERLKTLGVEFVKPPASYPWGTRSFWFRDPDRNIVNFFMVIN
jgi:catechol 2,3-dioxygenase-like lactoylglutathione lyase family enzyme